MTVSTSARGWHRASELSRFIRDRGLVPLLTLASVGMLAVPLPPVAIDCMVAMNLLVGVFLLSATIDGEEVLDLRAFPSLLLISTIFRLGVNVSTTRAILTTADAGNIVRTFGDFVVAGQVGIGLVVFLIVSIVQFLVVAKGGERVAEVAARFTLDALPGKQMSIDLDLKNGDITKEQARQRRSQIERESKFFGSMDGAMRFVKGDSIAGLLIVCVNLVGGLVIGVFQHGLTASEAARTYSTLSIGDGLAAQIPSILSTIAAGLLTTRVSDDAAAGGLSSDIMNVLRRQKRSLVLAAGALALLGIAPGFPHVVLLCIAGLVAAAVYLGSRRQGEASPSAASAAPQSTALPLAAFNDPFAAHLHPDLERQLSEAGFAALLAREAQRTANGWGVSLDVIRFRHDPSVQENSIVLRFEGGRVESFETDRAKLEGLAHSMVQRVVALLPKTLVVDDVEAWLDQQAKISPKLVETIRQQVPVLTLTHVLRRLLAEGVRLDHPRPMLMELAQSIATRFGIEDLLADSRLGLAEQIVGRLAGPDGSLCTIELDEIFSGRLEVALENPSSLTDLDEREGEFEALARQIADVFSQHGADGKTPALVVGDEWRADLRNRLLELGHDIPVLSRSEAGRAKKRNAIAQIRFRDGTSTIPNL